MKTIIFDLDGTLLDTLEDLSAAVNVALEEKGFPPHSVREYRDMVGHGVRNLVMQALPKERQADEALVDSCLARFTEYYTAHIDVHTLPYPGMQELMQKLRLQQVPVRNGKAGGRILPRHSLRLHPGKQARLSPEAGPGNSGRGP